VVRSGRRWSVDHGPFAPRALASLPSRAWTLLVQGTNLIDARADALMRRFDFIPYARLDDVMVSYAAPGAGVGPHVDSYDVFLLQGFGRRRWRWGAQRDVAFVPDLPLRILSRFAPDHDEVLGPGDMFSPAGPGGLTTASPSTRARPTWSGSARHSRRRSPRRSRTSRTRSTCRDAIDPDLAAATRTPARIPAAMQARFARTLGRIRIPRAVTSTRSSARGSSSRRPTCSSRRLARPGDRRVREGARAPRREAGPAHAGALRRPARCTSTASARRSRRRRAPRSAVRRPRVRPSTPGAASLDANAHSLLHDWYRPGWLHLGTAWRRSAAGRAGARVDRRAGRGHRRDRGPRAVAAPRVRRRPRRELGTRPTAPNAWSPSCAVRTARAST
ncbi:MAG: hypothetical protein IPG84_00940, partial [Betaproteobacteria bacterium]|nr:hypothetical protein [Betaproteobacteria bacterium]